MIEIRKTMLKKNKSLAEKLSVFIDDDIYGDGGDLQWIAFQTRKPSQAYKFTHNFEPKWMNNAISENENVSNEWTLSTLCRFSFLEFFREIQTQTLNTQ